MIPFCNGTMGHRFMKSSMTSTLAIWIRPISKLRGQEVKMGHAYDSLIISKSQPSDGGKERTPECIGVVQQPR